MHEAEFHWVKAAFWSSFNHLMQSVVSSYLQAIPSLSQSRHQLTDPKQADPCPLSSICVLLPSNIMPGAPGLSGVWGGGALALCCPFFQHFLFNSGFIESILIKNKRDGAWSLCYDLPCWFGHGHITESIHRVSTPSWGSLWHHALGQTGPWPHHLTCLLLSCLSTLGTALVWSSWETRLVWC